MKVRNTEKSWNEFEYLCAKNTYADTVKQIVSG